MQVFTIFIRAIVMVKDGLEPKKKGSWLKPCEMYQGTNMWKAVDLGDNRWFNCKKMLSRKHPLTIPVYTVHDTKYKNNENRASL